MRKRRGGTCKKKRVFDSDRQRRERLTSINIRTTSNTISGTWSAQSDQSTRARAQVHGRMQQSFADEAPAYPGDLRAQSRAYGAGLSLRTWLAHTHTRTRTHTHRERENECKQCEESARKVRGKSEMGTKRRARHWSSAAMALPIGCEKLLRCCCAPHKGVSMHGPPRHAWHDYAYHWITVACNS